VGRFATGFHVKHVPTAQTKPIYFEPGQYAFFEIERPGRKRDEHPFSVLDEENGRIKIGLKVIGDFTLSMMRLSVGSKVTVRGPYGTFGRVAFRKNDMVWIAGGIGITPYASMMKKLTSGQNVLMIHTTSKRAPKILAGIFEAYSYLHPNFRWFPYRTSELGRLTAPVIAKYVDSLKNKFFFLCGPEMMMKGLERQLIGHGVKRKQIIFEDFGFK